MALIVEDGTGLTNSDSYISVADASTRLANLGMTNWATLTQAEQEQALRRATTAMVQWYRERWLGFRRFPWQALDWPRWDVWVDNYPVDAQSVPIAVANACADLAFKAASGDLNMDLTQRVISTGVGPLRKTYDRYSPQKKRFPSIDQAVGPYLRAVGASTLLLRA